MFAAIENLASRPTPLLRFGPALLKLELYRAPRALPLEPFAATGHHALARARLGMQVQTLGSITHEMRKTLEIWGAQQVENAPVWQPDPAQLVLELLGQLDSPPTLVVAPAADSVALLAVLKALQAKWPSVRGVALLAEDTELPDLPLQADLPGVELVRVSFAAASRARARVASSLGLLASHASAAAAVHAFEHGGLALVTAPGEREFSLEPR